MEDLTNAQTGIKEACGVFGIYQFHKGNVFSLIHSGLYALQHRGQEACGIAVSDTEGERGNIRSRKGPGLVSEVFKNSKEEDFCGNLGIGHVRYSTTGASVAENAQPLVLKYAKGTIALAHNGNLVNVSPLREELERAGTVFHTTTDSEVIACLIARERVCSHSVEEAVLKAVSRLNGAYGLVIMSPRKLIGVRDPWGLKPLCLGKLEDAYLLASESCALTSIGAEFVRDIEPGELITITPGGITSKRFTHPMAEKEARCIFEYIYFARLDSTIDGVSVYESRIQSGKALARSHPVDADLVIGVPDSGLTAAKGYSLQSGIPFALAFYKNSYVGRTFIKPTQEERQTAVSLKLNVLASVVAGKRLVLVDDSIVRGTTIAALIQMLKKAGAKEIHVRISSPPFLHPCYFGTDVPSNRQLIASSKTPEEICRSIGADSLGYLDLKDLPSIAGGLPICKACFDADYPMEVS